MQKDPPHEIVEADEIPEDQHDQYVELAQDEVAWLKRSSSAVRAAFLRGMGRDFNPDQKRALEAHAQAWLPAPAIREPMAALPDSDLELRVEVSIRSGDKERRVAAGYGPRSGSTDAKVGELFQACFEAIRHELEGDGGE